MSATRRRLASITRAAAPLVILIAGAGVLLRFPPDEYSFYPQCPIHSYLHILCPGCGATRALAALLRGDVMQAFHLNALTMLLAPLLLIDAASAYRRFLLRSPLRWPQPPAAAIYSTLAAAIIFTVIRNL